MEKIIYALWRDPRSERAAFIGRLRSELAPRLVELGARGVQLNLSDAAADGAAPTLRAVQAPIVAFVSIWVDSANDPLRKPFDEAIGACAARFAAWLVSESQPMRNTRFPPAAGQRTEGFAQMALFRRPPRIDRESWLDVWLGSHTQIAIDTQDTFLYVQNVVTRALTFDAPPCDAIVEEGFPPAAFGNLQAFYGAVGDEEKFQQNVLAMRASCKRFIDMDKLDVVQTSQYVVLSPRWTAG
ncbi:EthD domain-containing protein [Aromatoleum diolicum]|uniref:EthD domain-containing protein n=1 Tax=Aromatoleum diolicum TaxID=75796 RepID=A0ABX1QHH3_9RHOO|nr:EthD domain-containing protein [Aromatoleum diolicum]NMG76495.1 hypothetical protein [Aromatoleum diolicum]